VKPIREGQILDFGTVKAHVLHTPGHSAGHCCFWFPEEEFLFSADICLTKVGPWYGEHYSDAGETADSIDRLIGIGPKRMASGHFRRLVTDCVPCLSEFKSRIFDRDERIHNYLRANPSDIHSLAKEKLIYKNHPTDYVEFWEKLMLLKHLERLEGRGLVRTESGVYVGI
jgi:glyoxylase-like metal-dependent hydrolase (beta-lactamase superfamily II)